MALLGIIIFSMDLTHGILMTSSNEMESASIWFSLLCIGLLLLPFAKWQWTNEILHNKILLYFIHFLWELTTGVVYNISWHENLVALESSKWTRIPTSLQVLGLYIPCSPRFCHLLYIWRISKSLYLGYLLKTLYVLCKHHIIIFEGRPA